MPDPAIIQATFCATLVDEWVRAGVTHAVVAPGSRSTPMALALAERTELSLHVHHDERCAAFTALGIGLASGVPAVLLCTSGTAATHFHGAVVEAHQAGVPLLVVTADRPPELRDVGAPQAIDQTHLYGRAVRWFHDPGVPDDAARGAWRPLAARCVTVARGWPGRPGPVHLNLPFREPLVGTAAALPPGRTDGAPWTRRRRERKRAPLTTMEPGAQRCLLVIGDGGIRVGAPWPTLAAATVGGSFGRLRMRRADAYLRVAEVAEALRPEVVVRSGRPLASRVVAEWLAATGAEEYVVGPSWIDPGGTAADVALAPSHVLGQDPDTTWLNQWRRLDAAANVAITAVLADHSEPTEPGAARTVLAALPAGAHLVVSSSMPVRDVEWYAEPRGDVTVHANRGANGIDGVLSTAVGVALAAGRPTVCLIGDVALLHDSNALLGLARRSGSAVGAPAGQRVDLTVVVVDNDGGGIFSFLPQAATVAPERFELLYGTPHGVRVEDLAAVHGIGSVTVETADALEPALRSAIGGGGVRFVIVRTDRQANVALHDEIHAAVAAAVRPLI